MKLNAVGKLKSLWTDKPWTRVIAAVFFIIPLSVFLLWFSVYQRLPVMEEITREVTLPHRLRAEIAQAKLRWDGAGAGIARDRLEEIIKRVPDSYDKLSELIQKINALASSNGFIMKYSLGDIMPADERIVGFSLLPINLKLKIPDAAPINKGRAPAGLEQFIRMIKNIVDTYYGIDIADIAIVGEGNGIKEMDVNFILWVGFRGETGNL